MQNHRVELIKSTTCGSRGVFVDEGLNRFEHGTSTRSFLALGCIYSTLFLTVIHIIISKYHVVHGFFSNGVNPVAEVLRTSRVCTTRNIPVLISKISTMDSAHRHPG